MLQVTDVFELKACKFSLYFTVCADACELPRGQEEASQNLSTAEVETRRLECYYANPTTDRAIILSGMAKTAAARQQWIRESAPSVTEVLDKYPRLEDMSMDLVRFKAE
jgi:hypothetical protein